jgi:hypothetical protein
LSCFSAWAIATTVPAKKIKDKNNFFIGVEYYRLIIVTKFAFNPKSLFILFLKKVCIIQRLKGELSYLELSYLLLFRT